MTRFRAGWAAVLAAAAIVGCGREAPVRLAPVSGRVVYKGKGVSGATVQLLAAAGAHAPSATGQTSGDGSFTLHTPPHGPGAAPGRYRVTVQQYGPPALPSKYASPADTPLTVVVPEEGLPGWEVKLQD